MTLDRTLRDRLSSAVHAATSTPTDEDLHGAPLLDGWLAVLEFPGKPVLLGHAEGHPSAGPGMISTSPLVKIDAAAGYARTIGRWYRLGRPMADTDPETVERIRAPECLTWHPIPEDKIDAVIEAVRMGIQSELNKAPLDA